MNLRTDKPWGYFERIEAGDNFQVKCIVINPSARFSLQMHHHRSEYWVVVSGKAKITRADEVSLLCAGQFAHIPVGTKHRLENVGDVPLKLIEVQFGSYLGEDDIVRLEDDYDRGLQP